MKITSLIAENFKKLTAVRIVPDGSTVILGGKNGAGKTSVLDAIEAAIGGAKHTQEEPVKRGAKAARVVVETDELVVTRTFPAKGNGKLEVKAKDGAVVTSPQALLDSLVGKISFDPMSFVRQEGKKPAEAKRARAEILRALVGLDTSKIDAEHKAKYDERTLVSRELERLDGALAKLPEPPAGTPDVETKLVELTDEFRRRQAANAHNEDKRRDLERLRGVGRAIIDKIEALERQLAAARAELDANVAAGKALAADAAALVDHDVEEIRRRIATAEETNAAVRAKHARAKLEAEDNAARGKHEALTAELAALDKAKADATAAAKYPIPGLAVTDDGITLDGVPFEQASSAQQLRVSAAIGLAANPKLRVLLIRDGSLLDPESLALVAKMAAEADAQVWIERVSTGGEVTVVIEDGEVADDRTIERTDGRQPAAGIG